MQINILPKFLTDVIWKQICSKFTNAIKNKTTQQFQRNPNRDISRNVTNFNLIQSVLDEGVILTKTLQSWITDDYIFIHNVLPTNRSDTSADTIWNFLIKISEANETIPDDNYVMKADVVTHTHTPN